MPDIGVVVAARWWTSTAEPVAAAYVTQHVIRGDLMVTVTATGTLAPINQVDIGSELSAVTEVVLIAFAARQKSNDSAPRKIALPSNSRQRFVVTRLAQTPADCPETGRCLARLHEHEQATNVPDSVDPARMERAVRKSR
jgi:hypothetical protein